MKLAVVGTRTLSCHGDKLAVRDEILSKVAEVRPEVIISGGAAGVDSIAEALAVDLGYSEDDGSLIVHRPTVSRWNGPGGFKERNARIAEDCTHLLRLACERSSTFGSAWTAAHAVGLGKIVEDIIVCPDGLEDEWDGMLDGVGE